MQSPIHAKLADPTNEAVDAFDCGEPEVNRYFRNRAWFCDGKMSPPTYEFRVTADAPIIGYASVAPRSLEHPSDASASKAKYLVIYAAGVNVPFQGALFQEAPRQTCAAAIFCFLATLRTEKVVGLSLRVRSDNLRAIAFYKKVGFVADPAGPQSRDKAGAPHLTMRQLAT